VAIVVSSVPFAWDLPYASRRQPVLADNVVATSQPLATQAGLSALARGGNAVDAAVATAIALAVVEPTNDGIGGDAFAVVWDGEGVHGLNASGRSPAGIDVERLLERESMPKLGWDTVTVPGAVSGWVALWQRFGRLGLDELAAPAIRYASEGFPVSPVVAAGWAAAEELYAGLPEFAAAFLPAGRAPGPGERFALPDQADTLEAIAATAGAAFYEGELAERIAGHARDTGGALTIDDLAAHRPEWVEPLSLAYGGATVWELPPNTQGVAALQALGILAHTPAAGLNPGGPGGSGPPTPPRGPGGSGPPTYPGSGEWCHWQVEAMKAAFADTYATVADPDAMTVDPAMLLDPARLRRRAADIDPERAGHAAPRVPGGGTVYLATADPGGMMVSLIQSNYLGFGSGIVVPGTGIALHNRGWAFSTEPGHPNAVAPAKRPFHTILPAFLTGPGGGPLGAFGLMGGTMHPQGHVQLVTRILDHGENPQAAIDAPRWRVDGDTVSVEEGMGEPVIADLRRRGHDVVVRPFGAEFGGAQMVWRLPSAYLGASEPRKDGHAAGF
jgi:gamma-glutamyltranspeptidase / glutathione hydrolase